MNIDVDENEHSLEMHLPYIVKAFEAGEDAEGGGRRGERFAMMRALLFIYFL